jgi:hypothetical protein
MSELRALASRLLPAPDGNEALYKDDGNTADIATKVMACFRDYNHQVANLAPYLKAASLVDTCRTLWQLVKNNIAYVVDPKGKQWIRTPARLFSDAQGDCKSYSVFIASCCYHLGIKGCFRFVSFKNGPPTHVYVVVKNKGREIILDAVMPAFNQQKPYHQKWDYNMTRISTLSGINNQQQIAGGLSTALNKGARRDTLNKAFPGLALLGLYIFIPGYGNTMPAYTHNSVGTPDNLFDRVPQVVKDKARSASDSFWDFGDWADLKVENEVFPKLKQLLTAQLGIDPHEWWRRQLRPAGIGSIGFAWATALTAVNTGSQAVAAGGQVSNILSNIKSTVGNFFGGSDIKWKRGDPSVWGPAVSDWASLGINPLAQIPVQGTTSTGQPLPVTYVPPATPVPPYTPTVPTVPTIPNNSSAWPSGGTPNDNTMLYVAGAALLALVAFKK